MSKTLKTLSVILSVLMSTGAMSVANPVLAAEVNEDYLMTETLNSLEIVNVLSSSSAFLGLDNTFDYHKQDVGRAGTIYFNDFNENIFIERDDLGLFTPYMPVQITSCFTNNADYSASGFGYGWRTNYHQTVEYINENGEEKYIYYDDNGKVYYFEKTEKTNDNKQVWEPTESKYLEDYGYILLSSMTDYNNLAEVSISCDKSIYRYFNTDGALCRISRSLKNSEDTFASTEYSTHIEYFNTEEMPSSLKLISKIMMVLVVNIVLLMAKIPQQINF